MPPGCDACSVSNRIIRVKIVRIGRIRTKGTMAGTNNRIRGRKGRINMVKVTVEVLCLGKTSRMKARRSIIMHVGGGMLKVNVGRMVIMLVVTTAEVGMPRRSVDNRIVVATE